MNSKKLGRLVGVVIVLLAGGARAPAAVPPPASEEGSTASAAPGTTLETRWRTSLYGFVELDAMHDTTQSYGPASNNAMLARPGTYAGAHDRAQFAVNNSQIGLRVAPPELGRTRTFGQAEIDFFGVQPTDATEQVAFTSPSVRVRLFYLKLETPIVDVLAGQYHDLFGWGGEGFYQNSLAFLGIAGEIYHRNPQIRVSRRFGGQRAGLDLAVAAVRPVQRDSAVPDLQGGIKLAFPGWRGATAQGFGQPEVLPVAVGVSAVGRRFAVTEFLTNPGAPRIAFGWGVAANAFLPVIPVRSAANKRNALSLTAELSIGSGISDLYTGLTGGALFPLLPDPSGGLVPPPIYRPNIDSGSVTYDANGNLKTIDWRSVVVGLQYYLPVGDGRMWIALGASRLTSANILGLTPEASRGGIFIQQDYADANLFATVTPALQTGVSYQFTQQTFGDLPFGGPHPMGRNQRVQIGARLFF